MLLKPLSKTPYREYSMFHLFLPLSIVLLKHPLRQKMRIEQTFIESLIWSWKKFWPFINKNKDLVAEILTQMWKHYKSFRSDLNIYLVGPNSTVYLCVSFLWGSFGPYGPSQIQQIPLELDMTHTCKIPTPFRARRNLSESTTFTCENWPFTAKQHCIQPFPGFSLTVSPALVVSCLKGQWDLNMRLKYDLITSSTCNYVSYMTVWSSS